MIQEERGWDYSPLETDMEQTGFKEIRVYNQKSQNTVVKYIATRPIMYLCK